MLGENSSDWELSRKLEEMKETEETDTRNGECKHAKEEVKTRQRRDAVVLEHTHSPPSNVVVEKISVRFLPNISTGYSNDVPNLCCLTQRKCSIIWRCLGVAAQSACMAT